MRAQVRRWIPKARKLAAGSWRDLVPRHVPEPGRKGEFALRHRPTGATVAGAQRRCIGNVPAIRTVIVDTRSREFA